MPGNLHISTAPGVGFSPNILSSEDGGFELEKFSTVLKNAGTSLFVSKKQEAA